MQTHNFIDLKPAILAALNDKLKLSGIIPHEDGFDLVDGFIHFPVQQEVGGAYSLGGVQVPSVMLVGKTSGRLYPFALKVILPNLEI